MSQTSRSHLPRRLGALMVSAGLITSIAGLAWMSPAGAATSTVGPIDFEPPAYAVGDIDGQNEWSKTGPYDVEVAEVDDFEAAEEYGFGAQALRASNEVTSGSFGDQTFSPGLADAAGEDVAFRYFTASFKIGSADADEQTGMSLSVSPDDGNGGRMSYLRFDDTDDGIEVIFVDTVNEGPLELVDATEFRDESIAMLSREDSHTIKFAIEFVDGEANDVVQIFVDGVLEHTGTTWEDYYRFSPEQTPDNMNVVPETSKLLFRAGGTAALANAGKGYLFDRVSLSSSDIAPVASPPPSVEGVNYDGNNDCADVGPGLEEFKIDSVPDDGIHNDPNGDLVITISNSSSQTFDWTSNIDISAVLVKGGAGGGGVQYNYPETSNLGDTGLHALVHDMEKDEPYYGISHVTFCYRVGGDTQPPPVTPTPPGDENPVVSPAGDQRPATPQPAVNPAANPALDGAEVQGVTLTLPRTGSAATPALVLVGGLGLAFGLAMLLLGNRKTAIEPS